MRNNKKEGERTPWKGETVQKFCRLWAIPAALWEKEVEDVLERLEVTIKDMWYKAEPGECGDSGIPEVRVWQPHLGNILDALFPDLAGLRTATGNINGEAQTWVQCWLKESLNNTRKVKDRLVDRLSTTESAIAALLGPNFWRAHDLDLGSLVKWTSQLGWTMKKSDEDSLKENELGDDANDAEMAARWELLTDNAKKIEWAGWAYGQVEVLINRVRPQNKKREIDLTILQNETLKAASATKSSQLANAKIRQATQEEIDEFDLILADNLRVWGANEVEVATEVFNSLWMPVDEDPDVERWREETFMGGTDLGVEEEKDLSSETLCEMLGWNHETGIPAAFSPYIPCDPTLPSGASGGRNRPPYIGTKTLPANASPIDKAIACRALKQGWANSPGVLLADDVGTGKTLQMLALVATLIQLFDYQESTGKTAPREEWPAALRFYESFGGREDGIPDAPHLFLIPSSILPQFVAEAHRFFRPGAVDIFTIGTAAKSWPADWARFHESKQKAIRRIVFMGHPTVGNLMSGLGVTYKDRVVFNLKELMSKTAQPFNKDWLTILIDEGHYARTGGKLYQAFQAAFETGLVRVVATATPMLPKFKSFGPRHGKTDIAHLTAQFETHRIAEDTMANSLTQKFGILLAGILKVFTADRIIRRTGRSKRNDGHPISEDLPPCTQVYVKVTLTPPELEAACDAMGGADVSQAIRDTGRLGGNFFLGARKETAYYGSSEKSTKELQDSEFANLGALNAQLSTKFKCTLLLIQKILTKGAGQFFSEDEIGVDSLVKQDSEMGLSIEGFSFVKINGTEMAGLDKKVLLHTEFSFLHNLIVSALKHIGITAIAISGASGTPASRSSDLDRFRTDPEIHVLVMSNVGAAGLNIAFCTVLIIFDAGWSKVHGEQVAGRINRRGQKRQSFVYQMAADGSIDMALLANGRNKGAMLKSFLSVSRNQAIWKQLNDQADDKDIREIYRDEYNMEMEELVEAKEVGKFKAFSLPGDEGLSDDGATQKSRKKAKRGKAQKKDPAPKNKSGKRKAVDAVDAGGKRAKKPRAELNPRLDIEANHVPNPPAA
ncbi:P-loop containing nucleoside triphosphate hydrolase protein [Mycena olivaceomarginata]|nr:P-loop containing nucleoside triphosphate hydrolase protein [Mycena olivaceomarginata]